MTPARDTRPFLVRFALYCQERFPPGLHLPFAAVLALAMVAIGAASAPDPGPPLAALGLPLALATLAALGRFLQLRVADEHKDAATDAAHRPERPVPRGLITLSELRLVGMGAALVELGAVLMAGQEPAQLAFLAVVFWFLCMTSEFGAKAWLHARPWLLLVSHMVILPLIGAMLLLMVPGARLDGPALVALAALFGLGAALEIGRKVPARPDWRDGVETYAQLKGTQPALRAFGRAAGLGLGLTLGAARSWPGFALALLCVLAGVLLLARAFRRFREDRAGSGKEIERAGGFVVLLGLMALTLGALA